MRKVHPGARKNEKRCREGGTRGGDQERWKRKPTKSKGKVGVIEKGKKKVLPRPCVKIGKTAFSWIAKRKKSTRLKVRTNI